MSWDALLSVLVLGSALVLIGTGARTRRACGVLAATGIVACAALVAADLGYRRERAERQIVNRPLEVEGEGYVSSDSCRSCHPSHHASWAASFHSTMTQVASPASVVESFGGQVLERDGVRWELARDGDRYYVRREKGSSQSEHEIVMTTGSHHFQGYWFATEQGRMVDIVPIGYRYEEQEWIPLDSAFLLPPGLRQQTQGRWNVTCNRCHSTHPRTRPQGNSFDTLVAEFGIACESCHGPAEEHVAAQQNPLHRYASHWSDAEEPTLVDPTDLPRRRASQVCGQCHSVNRPPTKADRIESAIHGSSFRPGDELTATRLIESEGDEWFWPDGMIRVSGREYNGLLRTPCYTHGDEARTMSCLSCHELHPAPDDPRPLEEWADDQLAPGMESDAACIQCHEPYADAARRTEHSHHAADSPGSACYDCHMPHTTYGLLKGIRSHELDSPSVATTLASGRPNACNLCHLDRTLAWTAEHLHDWFGQPPPEALRGGAGLDEDERSVSAAVLGLLRGNAGERALLAWHAGWQPAQQASGTEWLAPYLGQLLADPYDAVRFISYRSLRGLDGFEGHEYDFLAPPDVRRAAVERVRQTWRQADRCEERAELLVGPDGDLVSPIFQRLLAERDDRDMILAE